MAENTPPWKPHEQKFDMHSNDRKRPRLRMTACAPVFLAASFFLLPRPAQAQKLIDASRP